MGRRGQAFPVAGPAPPLNINKDTIMNDPAHKGETDGDEARLERYMAERTRAQALKIQASMEARRNPGAPERCEGAYKVMDR